MQVFSLFENSVAIELAISKLELEGLRKEQIFIVPIDESKEGLKVFDSIHDSDGISMIDKGMAFATAFGVIGTSIGFRLEWGPIIWGLIGAGLGFLLGFLLDIAILKFFKNSKREERKVLPLNILIVDCEQAEVKMVEKILMENKAIGINTPLNL